MKTLWLRSSLAAFVLAACLGHAASVARGQYPPHPNRTKDDRAGKPDSYIYYGPNNLWHYWNYDANNKNAASQRLGRDTWIHWTWGNQKVIRRATIIAGQLPVPVSIDFFRLLDSRERDKRFQRFGLINEPNCKPCTNRDKTYGLYLDEVDEDPEGYYPVKYDLNTGKYEHGYRKAEYRLKYPVPPPDANDDDLLQHFGHPSGIVGIRLFRNPKFEPDEKFKPYKWDIEGYFKNPGKVEPPYLVGFTCALCHIAFDPKNPPTNPAAPNWRNLAANIGNQYFREGALMFGKGRILFGDQNPDPKAAGDPYQTKGLDDHDFLYHYAVTQQPGTSETSRISYDFINNPNTINPIYGLSYRPTFDEETPWGGSAKAWHALKDGADAVGPVWALMRVPINIGCEGDYWIDQLFNPLTGRRQRPVGIAPLLAGLPADQRKEVVKVAGPGLDFDAITPARLAQLQTRYQSPYGKAQGFGRDWQEAWWRVGSLKAYLESYYWPSALRDARPEDPADARAAAAAAAADGAKLAHGAKLFGAYCGRCHSNKPPKSPLEKRNPDRFYTWSASQPFFWFRNFLAEEVRHPVYPPWGTKPDLSDPPLGTNLARALGTNAVHGDIWAEFSSVQYKALTRLGRVTLDVPVFPPEANLPWAVKAPIRVEFDPPAGGRGYYRTPSLISMWATAPYLHNNSVGDYYVILDDRKDTRGWVSNDGTRWRQDETQQWAPVPCAYRIDVSVEGRVKMFQDGMWKLLTPARRHNWVKRTSDTSALVPDLGGAVHSLIARGARDGLRRGLRRWVQENALPAGAADEVGKAVEAAFDQAVQEDLKEQKANLPLALSVLRLHVRNHAGRLFDLTFDYLQEALRQQHKPGLADFQRSKPALRRAFLEQLEGLEDEIHNTAKLELPRGTPVNLYANLNPAALAYAALAHVQYRDDPRALAEALLHLSDCPDLVEDRGHYYGTDLTDADKADLIEFLKTL
jgi:hypothetical protein